ncbi:transporter substrate-binding domain-containing protein [Piscinibacter sakaiensis]|uniref:Putative extracellular solute-binding protein n=1 Tax=Piscinibacter sakaiensis TaxID=1547922 RepID=A0A0K8P5S4_PISS1|nr:transporter substrate-binding domain-containing protein [Piscinibacter sakaiensis]GAP37859.1 putative extracellular solute-binding protein [Piscinibacter sakaiensis]
MPRLPAAPLHHPRRTLAAAAAGAGLLGLGVAWLGREDTLARLQRAGQLRAGYAVEAPYAVVLPDGSVGGESPRTLRHVAARLGLDRIDWLQLPFEGLIDALRARRVDVVSAGLFVTPARAARVRFADPTLRVRAGLLRRRSAQPPPAAYADLARPGAGRIAALQGSVEQERLATAGLPAAALLAVPDALAARAALHNGAAAAFAISLPAARMLAMGDAGLEALAIAAGPGLADDWVASAFHPDDASLQRAWNTAQAGWVGSAEHLALVQGYGFEAADLATGVTLAQVLGR